MIDLTALIQEELRKIAFLLKADNILDKLELSDSGRGNRKIKNVLESLPVKWDKVIPFGKFTPRYYDFGVSEEEKSWAIAELSGKLNGDPLKLIILKNPNYYKYILKFKEKKYHFSDIDYLSKKIKDLSEKKEDGYSEIINKYRLNLLKNKDIIVRHLVEKLLSKISDTKWSFMIKKTSEITFVIILYTFTEAEKSLLEKKLSDEMNEIISYLKTFIDKDAEKISFNFSLIKKQRNLGANIVVRLKKEI